MLLHYPSICASTRMTARNTNPTSHWSWAEGAGARKEGAGDSGLPRKLPAFPKPPPQHPCPTSSRPSPDTLGRSYLSVPRIAKGFLKLLGDSNQEVQPSTNWPHACHSPVPHRPPAQMTVPPHTPDASRCVHPFQHPTLLTSSLDLTSSSMSSP